MPVSAHKKLEILKKVVKEGRTVSSVCKEAGIARKTLYQWKKRYEKAPNRIKRRSLKPHYLSGRKHPKNKRFKFKNRLIPIVVQLPSWGSRKISSILCKEGYKLSNHAVYNLLKDLNLETKEKREEFSSLYQTFAKIERIYEPRLIRLTPGARKRIVEEVVIGGEIPSRVCQKHLLSRKTFYKWLNRYSEAREKEKILLQAMEDNYLEGFAHPRSVSEKVQEKILSVVRQSPEYSTHKVAQILAEVGNHGVQNVFKRLNLNTYGKRLVYAQTQMPAITPVPEVTGRLAEIFGKIPVISAIPPSLRYAQSKLLRSFQNVKYLFRPSFFSFLSSIIFSTFFIHWLNILAQAPTPGQKVGLIFASMALLIGSFFFAYSMKYYLTLALVLSFSREAGAEGVGIGLSGEAKRGSNGSWLARVFGIGPPSEGKAGGAGLPPEVLMKGGGLQPSLDHIKLERYPFVSIHLPFYNEKKVAERILKACTSIDYPAFEVIVCDDSTDETTAIVQSFAARWNKQINTNNANNPIIKVLHRPTRKGFKGGALSYALKHMDPRTEFCIVFDADFIPYPDTLIQFMKYFKASGGWSEEKDYQSGKVQTMPYDTFKKVEIEPKEEIQIQKQEEELLKQSPIACVAGYQWHVLNKSENWITRGVRTEYAGSYVIERPGQEILGGFKIIHGSVYMIRADVLKHFGWGTSITEDFELTLRLYEQGLRVVYTPYVQAPSECVSTIKRLIRQRMRWSEGHSFNVRKMFVKLLLGSWSNMRIETNKKRIETNERIWQPSPLTLMEKLEFLYLSPYYLQAAFFVLGTFSWLISETVFRARLPFWTSVWGWSLVLTNFFSLPLMNAVGMFLEEAEEKDYAGILSFIALSYILVPFQAYASVKGFLEKEEGPWFRTPKTGKITDIFTRGRFYRWVSGILPGGRLAPAAASAAVESAIKANPYLALATANNQFENFSIPRKKARWAGKSLLVVLLIFSTILLSLAPVIPYFSKPKETQAKGFGTVLGPNNSNQPVSLSSDFQEEETKEIFLEVREDDSFIEMANSENKEAKIKIEPYELPDGVELDHKIEEKRLKEEIVLKKPVAGSPNAAFTEEEEKMSLRARLELEGLEPRESNDGYYFFDKENIPRLQVFKPFMVDSQGERSEEVEIEIKETGASVSFTGTTLLGQTESSHEEGKNILQQSHEVDEEDSKTLSVNEPETIWEKFKKNSLITFGGGLIEQVFIKIKSFLEWLLEWILDLIRPAQAANSGSYVISLTPNKDWLSDPQRAYPVIINSTFEVVINILTVYSHPQKGDDWVVSFETVGQADLTITPVDQASIDDLEFVSLTCDGQERTSQIKENDIIFYPNWECLETGNVTHLVNVPGKHALKFQYGNQIAFAYNSPWGGGVWRYRFKYEIPNAKLPNGESLTDFPFHIDLADAPSGFWQHVDADGDDIRVIDSDDSTQLTCHLEGWDSWGTNKSGHLWCKKTIAQDTGSNTDWVYVYYGNASASDDWNRGGTYKSSFKGVWDLGQAPGGIIHAYPHGAHTQREMDAAKLFFLGDRDAPIGSGPYKSGGSRLISQATVGDNEFETPPYEWINQLIGDGTESTIRSNMQSRISSWKTNHEWAIEVFHKYDDMTADQLDWILDEVHDDGEIWVATYGEALEYLLENTTPPSGYEAIFTLTADDGYDWGHPDTWAWFPVLKKYDDHITFFVQNLAINASGGVSTDELQEISRMGHDVQDHNYGAAIPYIPDEAFKIQYTGSAATCTMTITSTTLTIDSSDNLEDRSYDLTEGSDYEYIVDLVAALDGETFLTASNDRTNDQSKFEETDRLDPVSGQDIKTAQFQVTTTEGMTEDEMKTDMAQMKARVKETTGALDNTSGGNDLFWKGDMTEAALTTGVSDMALTFDGSSQYLQDKAETEYSDDNKDTDIKLVGTAATQDNTLGQGFKLASAASVGTVRLWLKRTGTFTNADLFIEIQTDSSGVPSGTPVTNGTSQETACSSIGTSYEWVEFKFSTHPSLSADTQYHVVLKGNADYTSEYNATTTYIQWGVDQSLPFYPDGAFATGTDDASWAAYSPASDGVFEVYSDELNLTSSLSVGAWIKPTAVTASEEDFIIGKRTAGTSVDGYGLYQYEDDVYFRIDDTDVAQATSVLSADTWALVVGTFDGTTARVYVNGTVGAVTDTGTISDVSTLFRLGFDQTKYFDGSLDAGFVATETFSVEWIEFLYLSEKGDAGTAQAEESSVSPSATAYSFQRKTWFDGTRLWKTYHADGDDRIEFWYSTDWGENWTENDSARILVDTNDFTIEATSSGVLVAYTDGFDVKVDEDDNNYPATNFTWSASPTTVYDGSSSTDEYDYPAITRDSSDKVWITARYTTGGTVDKSVAASGDDGAIWGASSFSVISTTLRIGEYDNYNNDAFFLWTGVTISGTITTSYIELYGHATGGTSPLLRVRGVDEDNPPAPTTRGQFDADPLTDAGVDWDGLFTVGSWNQSDSLNSIFQELVNTYTISNEAVMVQVKDDGSANGDYNTTRAWNSTSDTTYSAKLYIEYANYEFVARQSYVNDISNWETASSLDSSGNSNKYGTIVPLTSGNMYSIWIDDDVIEGKKYTGSWGSATTIATGVTGMTKNMSAVASTQSSVDYVHLIYDDSSSHVIYDQWDSSSENWTSFTNQTLDSAGTCEYLTLSKNTANDDLYALWIRSDDIYYSTDSSPYTSWSSATSWQTEGTNKWVTSNYSGDGMIFAEWTKGSDFPYTVEWDYIIIPENLWLFLLLSPFMGRVLKKLKKKKKRQ